LNVPSASMLSILVPRGGVRGPTTQHLQDRLLLLEHLQLPDIDRMEHGQSHVVGLGARPDWRR